MWHFLSLRHIIFKLRPIVLHTGLLLWWHLHTPKRDANRNELWLVVWNVSQTASWVGFGQWKLPWIPDLQPSVWRSGYARLDMILLSNIKQARLPISRFSSTNVILIVYRSISKYWVSYILYTIVSVIIVLFQSLNCIYFIFFYLNICASQRNTAVFSWTNHESMIHSSSRFLFRNESAILKKSFKRMIQWITN